MKTFTNLYNLFGTLSLNSSTNNLLLGKQLINDQHRYLLQRYFDNERTATFSTVGSQSLTATGSISSGATSATLSSAWIYQNCIQLVNFSDGEQRSVTFTLNSTAISWSVPLTATVTSAISTLGIQDYSIPADISKIKNNTITIGQIKFQPTPVQTRQEWDMITTLPYNSDIPNYFFIYNGKLSIFPIPSTTGNVGTVNYKGRVPDMTYADYGLQGDGTSTSGSGTLATMVVGSTAVTGTTTSWNTTGGFPLNTVISFQNLFLRADPGTGGDGIWYPIYQFNSNTSLTLGLSTINAPNISITTKYTIGQIPLLQEDFHDMLVHGALMIYFSSIVKDDSQFKKYEALYNSRLDLLKEYAGTKQVNVDLEGEPQQLNPNLFLYSNS